MEENFERELSWCIQQLELGLESQNPDSRQGREAVKVLKILTSSKAPLVKKRQAMRNTFGDYRKKMSEQEKKSAARAKKAKLITAEPSLQTKSKFFKKSANQNSAELHVPVSTIEQIDLTSDAKSTTCDIPGSCGSVFSGNDADFMFKQTDSPFKFQFSNSENTEDSKECEDNTEFIQSKFEGTTMFQFTKSDNSFRFKFQDSAVEGT